MTRPAPDIRVRTDADLPGAAAALVEVHDTDGYPVEGVADPVAWLTGASLRRAWVAEIDGRVVGHVAVSEPRPDDAAATLWRARAGDDTSPVAVVGRLFVVQDARRRGAGERLMTAVQDHAHRHGLRLVLDVMTKDTAAIALYERLGWERIGTTGHDNGRGASVPALCYVGPA